MSAVAPKGQTRKPAPLSDYNRWPPGAQLVGDPAEDAKGWVRHHALGEFGQLVGAIALAWKRSQAESLRAEYSRPVGWAFHDPETVTRQWLREQMAGYVPRARVERPRRAPRELTAEELEAFAWALGLEAADLPAFPFRTRVGITVTGPRDLPYLQAEIRRGPSDRRVSTGATLADVVALREAIARAAEE